MLLVLTTALWVTPTSGNSPHATLKITPQVCLDPCKVKVSVKVNAEEYDRSFAIAVDGEVRSTRPIVPYTVEIPYTIREEGDHMISLIVLDQSEKPTFITSLPLLVKD